MSSIRVLDLITNVDLEIGGKPWAGKNLMVVTTPLGSVTIHDSSHNAEDGNESVFFQINYDLFLQANLLFQLATS